MTDNSPYSPNITISENTLSVNLEENISIIEIGETPEKELIEVSSSPINIDIYEDVSVVEISSGSAVQGPAGPKGDAAATITVGTTTTGANGSPAAVTNSGTSSAVVLNFTIPRGEKGDPGNDGVDGLPGATGPKGDKGDTGASGTNGLPGADGDSAYQVAVSNGFTGTESQWLASLVGTPGTNGTNGTNGVDGADGAPGTSINIKGSVANTSLLPMSINQINDAYIVDLDGNLWVWNGTAWFDAGQIVGPQGIQGNPGAPGDPGPGVAEGGTAGQILSKIDSNDYNTEWVDLLIQPGALYQSEAPVNPEVGQIWIDSNDDIDVFDQNIIRRQNFTAIALQDTFTTDIQFIPGYEQVFMNGILLVRGTDYTTPTNNTVVLAEVTSAGDILEVLTVTNLNSADTYTQAEVDALLASNTSVAPLSISANTSLVAKKRYFVTSASSLTLTLPGSPTLNDEIQIVDASGNASVYNINIDRNGNLINGNAGNLIVDTDGGWYTLLYTGNTYGWKVG